MLDADLVTKAHKKKTAICQFEMLKQADKLKSTALKEIVKGNKRALKDGAINSDAALEAKLQAVLSSNDKIEKAHDKLVKGVDRKCAALDAPPDTIFPGECGQGNPNLRQVEACVIAAARCEACLNFNALNDLSLDCDQADDQAVNGSCL